MRRPGLALALGLALTAAAPFAPTTASAADNASPCFFVSQWRGWSAPEPGMLYLKVGNRDVYRVEVSPSNRKIDRLGTFLVSESRRSSICSHLDLDLRLADRNGFQEPLIARSLVKLTPAQIAAIPPKDLP